MKKSRGGQLKTGKCLYVTAPPHEDPDPAVQP